MQNISQIVDRCASLAISLGHYELLCQTDKATQKIKVQNSEQFQLSIVLAMLGLVILLIGTFLLLWMLSRYMRRSYIDEPEIDRASLYAQFGYKYFDSKFQNEYEDE